MQIVVGVKQVFDVDQIKIDPNTREPMYDAPLKLDDLSKNALEEAIRIRESKGGRVTAILVGGERVTEAVKEALAIGADEAKVILAEEFLDTAATAKAISEVIKSLGSVDLILFGHASVDSYSGQIGPRVAEILGLPIVTHAREVRIENGIVRVVRDLEESFEEVQTGMPCVLTVTNEINEPRLPTLSQILTARKKPSELIKLSDLGFVIERKIEVISNRAPKLERKRKVYRDDLENAVREIVSELKKEGIV